MPVVAMHDKPRTLLLAPDYFDGRFNGIGRVAEAIYYALRQTGHSVDIWSANDPKTAVEPLGENRAFGRRYLRMMLAAALQPPRRTSLVACLHLGLSPGARLLAWRRRCPYFVFLHGIEAWRPVRKRAVWGLRGADLLVANSRHTLARFRECNPGLAAIPAVVTPLGVAGGSAVRVSSDFPMTVLTVTRLTKSDAYKNIRVLIDAFRMLIDDVPNARLVIVGEGDDRADLEKYSTKLPAGQVMFAGRISDDALAEWWQQASVFALPSENEGFGLVYAEAMAHGIPCVCGNRDAAREVVIDGETGFVVDPRSAGAVADALRRILMDHSLRKRMKRAATKRFDRCFTKARFEARFLEMLRTHGLIREPVKES